MYGKTGEKSASWRGGYTQSYGLDWVNQKEKALKRDDYTCQLFGCDNQKKLVVHHLIPYRISKDNSLGNLLTLGREHHPMVECSELTTWLINEYVVSNVMCAQATPTITTMPPYQL